MEKECQIRILKEWEDFRSNPLIRCTAGPKHDNLLKWKATIVGPSDTPYEGGLFLLSITFPSEYPYIPPKLVFDTKIYHPNIDYKTGYICLNILKPKSWTPALTIKKVILSISSLLNEPNFDDPIYLFMEKNNNQRYKKIAKQWTLQYA